MVVSNIKSDFTFENFWNFVIISYHNFVIISYGTIASENVEYLVTNLLLL